MAHGQAREGSSGAALPFAPSNGTEQQAVLSVHSLAQKALLLCHCFNSQAADLMKTATGAMAKKHHYFWCREKEGTERAVLFQLPILKKEMAPGHQLHLHG